MRLIDADKVLEIINECVWDAYGSNEDEMGNAYSIARGIVEEAPTVEAIPIEWLKEFYKNTSVSIPVGVPMIKILEELESAYKAMAERE